MAPRVDATPSFFGRSGELDAARQALVVPGAVVVLTGPGGIGKTRTAAELTARATRTDEPLAELGVGLVELAETTSEEGFVGALAGTLDLPRRGSAPWAPAELDAAFATVPPTLLMVDSPERVLSPLREGLARWRSVAPQVRWVVCSRIELGVGAERRVELGPLSADDASALFLERARAHQWDFAVRPDDDAQLAWLVERLEGIPLALELAAARVRTLGLSELVERLDSHLDLLRHKHARADRHATMRRTVDWSLGLLAPEEREALVRASVFRGSFTLDAFEAVVAPDAGPGDAVALLEALLDHSLARAFVTDDGARRFRLYEVVRQLASEGLDESGAGPEVQARHARHYLSRFRATVPGAAPSYLMVLSPAETRLADDLDNLLAGMERHVEHEPSLAARCGLQAARLLFRHGADEVLWSLLDRAAEAATRAGDGPTRGRLLLARVFAERVRHRGRDIAPWLAEARAIADAEEDAPLRAAVRCHEAIALNDRYESAAAVTLFHEALTAQRAIDDTHGQLASLLVLVSAHVRVGETEAAAATSQEAVALARELGDERLMAIALRNEAATWDRLGRYEDAFAQGQQALAFHRRVDDRWGELLALVNLAYQATCVGRYDEARAYGSRAQAIVDRTGWLRPMRYPDHELGWLELALGRLEASRQRFDRCLADAERLGHDVQRGASLGARGACHLAAGDAPSAIGDLRRALAVKAKTAVHQDAQLEEALLALALVLDGREADGRAMRALAEEHAARWPVRAVDEVLAVVRQALGEEPTPAPDRSAPRSPMGLAAERAWARRSRPEELALVVGPSAQWLEVPRRPRLQLARRPVARRIVRALVQARREAPGEALPSEALIASVWPDDRSHQKDLANRLWVAVSGLRKGGLDAVLQRHDDGYRLDPAVPLVEAERDLTPDPRST